MSDQLGYKEAMKARKEMKLDDFMPILLQALGVASQAQDFKHYAVIIGYLSSLLATIPGHILKDITPETEEILEKNSRQYYQLIMNLILKEAER